MLKLILFIEFKHKYIHINLVKNLGYLVRDIFHKKSRQQKYVALNKTHPITKCTTMANISKTKTVKKIGHGKTINRSCKIHIDMKHLH